MRLKHLTIANCSRVSDIDIEVRDNLVLIGPNGSGKSTVLLCLDMLLGANGQRLHDMLTPGFIRDASRPMTVKAVFADLSEDERSTFAGAFGAGNNRTLSVKLEANLDGSRVTVEKSFPDGPSSKSPTEVQVAAFGWSVIQERPATCDVRQWQESAAVDASSRLDFEATEASANEIISQMEAELSQSSSSDAARRNLLDQLAQTLPFSFENNDLQCSPKATAGENVIGDTQGTSQRISHMRLANEHSDGMRALFTKSVYELVHSGVNVLAIDEPEAHLHPSSQRSLAKMLRAGSCQKILVTHSPTIAGSFEPDEIVVIGKDGCAVQPEANFLEGESGMMARWWIGKQLEPLTASSVIAVEGPSDRIIVNKVASAIGFDLDRHDVVIVETSGCGDMKVVESIFGSGGFEIPLFELVDQDAADDAARRLGIDEADLEARNMFVSARDLEDEYVRAIGARRLWDKFKATKTFSTYVLENCPTGRDGYPTEADLAQFIREKSKRKIPAALVAANLIDETNALRVESVARLLEAVNA